MPKFGGIKTMLKLAKFWFFFVWINVFEDV